MKISIIIPCFNEEKTLSKIVDKVLKFKSYEKEIIIVDWSSKKSLTYLEKEDESLEKNSTILDLNTIVKV